MNKPHIKLIRLLLSFLLLGGSILIHGQDFIVGIQYSIDNQNFIRHSDDFKTPDFKSSKIGLITEFSPFFSKFFISTGAEYMMNDIGNSISIPLTFRLALGEKIRPFIEGGAYYNYVLEDSEDEYIYKSDLGAKTEIGLLFILNKKWRIEAGYNYNFGFTPALEEEILLPLNQVSIEQYRRRESGFSFRVKHRF